MSNLNLCCLQDAGYCHLLLGRLDHIREAVCLEVKKVLHPGILESCTQILFIFKNKFWEEEFHLSLGCFLLIASGLVC